MIVPGHSILDYDCFYRFDYMEKISFQKKVVKGMRNRKSWFRIKDDFLFNHLISFSPHFFQE